MPMLTWEEVQAALRNSERPDDLERIMADYTPQGIIDQLMEELIDYYAKRGADAETAGHLVTAQMCGFHLGWMLARKAYTGE